MWFALVIYIYSMVLTIVGMYSEIVSCLCFSSNKDNPDSNFERVQINITAIAQVEIRG